MEQLGTAENGRTAGVLDLETAKERIAKQRERIAQENAFLKNVLERLERTDNLLKTIETTEIKTALQRLAGE